MKHEWRKVEKELYLPKQTPTTVDIPAMKYVTISGTGNPNSEEFSEKIQALFAFSYGVKMSYKKDMNFDGYFDYTVYPLEGVWDINDAAKKKDVFSKDDFVYKIMIRQPDFVNDEVFSYGKQVAQSKGVKCFDQLKLEEITEGQCVQILHVGPFANESVTFGIMEQFCEEHGLKRLSKVHREIYLSDMRKVEPEKLKTVLRFKVQPT